MESILKVLADTAAQRVQNAKQQKPFDQIQKQAKALGADTGYPFRTALGKAGLHFICEVKRASPSKGMIAPDFPYLQLAQEYVQAGAAAISVLTEPSKFLGKDEYLQEIAEAVPIPVLRKDFIVDVYQLYEARLLGASAVLLICALLTPYKLEQLLQATWYLGMDALVEVHTADEVQTALGAGANIIGVNNRDLHTFTVDISTSIQLRALVPADKIFVAESGIHTPEDIALLQQADVNAVLIGEALMRAPDKRVMLDTLRGVR